jgi:hypothetical protein
MTHQVHNIVERLMMQSTGDRANMRPMGDKEAPPVIQESHHDLDD